MDAVAVHMVAWGVLHRVSWFVLWIVRRTTPRARWIMRQTQSRKRITSRH